MPVHVIGASGRSGTAVCRALLGHGETVIAVLRDRERLAPDVAARCADIRVADLMDEAVLSRALGDAQCVVNTAHARHIPAILRAIENGEHGTEAALVALGSTRKFTRWPDAHGNGVLTGERALLASRRQAILLHPTMIYGAQGEDNVQRLATLLRRLPLVPLPGGGRVLVQPIHQDDVTRAIVAATDLVRKKALEGPCAVVIAGPDAIAYRDFVAAITEAAAIRPRPIIPLPVGVLMIAAPMLGRLPGMPRIGRDEIRRLMEDKAFDTTAMRNLLGIQPVPLREGLAKLFS